MGTSTSRAGCGQRWAHGGLGSGLGNRGLHSQFTKELCVEQVLHEPRTPLQDTAPAVGTQPVLGQ